MYIKYTSDSRIFFCIMKVMYI